MDIHDDMLTALVELLEEKGLLKYSDWEARIRRKVGKDDVTGKDRGKWK